MIDSGIVSNDASIIETIFNKYQESMNSISDSIWQGASKNNAISKSQEFVSQYKNVISNQMNNLENAINLYKKYKEQKETLKRAQINYNNAVATKDDAGANNYNNQITNSKSEMESLKPQINNLLNTIVSAGINCKTAGSPSSAQNFLSVAKQINSDLQGKKAKYSLGSGLYWNNIEKSIASDRTCCATYVSSVIYKSGLASESEMNSIGYNSSSALYNHFKKKWQTVNSVKDLQAGDIVFMTSSSTSGIGHVQIYAGDGKWYNAGSTKAIYRGEYSDSSQNYRFIKALRPDYK